MTQIATRDLTTRRDRHSILALLDEPQALPPVPPVAQQVVRLAEEDTTTAVALADVISRDPALAGRLLRVANSAFFGFSRRVETVTLAVTLLGFRAVRNMVLAVSLKSLFRTFGILERRLWAQSVCMGIAASELARRTRTAAPEEAFVAGLLADSGQAVMLELMRAEYQPLLLTAYREGVEVLDLERQHFGVGHDEIGAALARRWNLPETLEKTIRQHHAPADPNEPPRGGLARLVRTADAVARVLGAGRPNPTPQSHADIEEALAGLGLGAGTTEEVFARVRARFERDGYSLG